MAAASPLALAALAFPDFPSGLCSPAAGNARGEVSPLPAAFDDDLAWATTPKGLVSPKGGFPQSDELAAALSWWPMPELEDRSPDVSPACSEDECSVGDKPARKETRKRKHASRHAVNEADCPALLEEDSDEFKVRAFPAVEERARQTARVQGDKLDAVACMVEAFTHGHKHGRPLPAACDELIKRATDEVSESKKRQRVKGAFKASAGRVDEGNGAAHFPCASCAKEYSTAEGLRLHVRNHHEVDKRWVCHAPSCCASAERAFVRQADLRMHIIRVHSPVRPFPCRVPGCNKAFSANNELRRHIANFHLPLAERLFAEGRQ